MANYNTVLNDLLNQFPRYQFDRAVQTLGGDRYHKKLSTWNQFTVLLYAQASGKSSLREIENGLMVRSNRAYHLGFSGKIARSTLSDANRRRSCAIKLHYQFDNANNLPVFMAVTEATRQDMPVAAEKIKIIPDSIYCFDRGYSSLAWFRRITDEGAFFVTRAKSNMAAAYLGQQERPQGEGVLADFKIETTSQPGRRYPYPLRLIAFYDSESGRYLEFLTTPFC